MNRPKAIGFDLFNTLMTVHPDAMRQAHENQLRVLHEENIEVEGEAFGKAYVEAAIRHIKVAHKDGRETHNSLWVAEALESLGHELSPEDPLITKAVAAYFSAFYPNSELIPGTKEILAELGERYPLGMITNFTDGPAARNIIDVLGLNPFFRHVVVSGEIGYRKPHPYIFERFVEEMGVPADQMIFVGDDQDADVEGAKSAGLRPVLTTVVEDAKIPAAKTPMSPAEKEYPDDVPRISSWQDLRDLLEA
jgi:putative hydrolase of the HAD superfamily